MGERLLCKRLGKAAVMKLKPEEFEHVKTGERQRLKTLHQAQVSTCHHACSCLYSDLALAFSWPAQVSSRLCVR